MVYHFWSGERVGARIQWGFVPHMNKEHGTHILLGEKVRDAPDGGQSYLVIPLDQDHPPPIEYNGLIYDCNIVERRGRSHRFSLVKMDDHDAELGTMVRIQTRGGGPHELRLGSWNVVQADPGHSPRVVAEVHGPTRDGISRWQDVILRMFPGTRLRVTVAGQDPVFVVSLDHFQAVPTLSRGQN